MKILVIDNITNGMPNLRNALKGYRYDIIRYNKIKNNTIGKYDKIILSGGHAFNVLHSSIKYKKEINLITKCKKPIMGICLGFQLICKAYGAEFKATEFYGSLTHGLKK